MANTSTTRYDSDLDTQSPAADLVRVYLNGIGKTALLTAEDEVELAKRIEAGLYTPSTCSTPVSAWARSVRTLSLPSPLTGGRHAATCWRRTCAWWYRWPSATPAAVCRCWI